MTAFGSSSAGNAKELSADASILLDSFNGIGTKPDASLGGGRTNV